MKFHVARTTVMALFCCLLMAFPVMAQPTEEPDEEVVVQAMPLVAEAEGVPDYIYYYTGKEKVEPSTFSWVAGGIKGDAVKLNGEDQYLRLATAKVKELSAFTFSAWVKRPFTEANEENDHKLLTVYKNENRYLTLSLDKQDEEKGINGICLELQDRAIDPLTLFRPASVETTTALPTDNWHHVAVTFSDTEVAVYVDGAAYLQQTIDLSITEMDLRNFVIGGGFYGEKPLNAMLDNVLVYNAALSAKQIALLAQNTNPLSGASPITTTEVLATAPLTFPSDITIQPQTGLRVLGLPVGLVVVLAAFILVAIVLSVVLTRRNKQEESDHL